MSFLFQALKAILKFANDEVHDSRLESRAGELGNILLRVHCNIGTDVGIPLKVATGFHPSWPSSSAYIGH